MSAMQHYIFFFIVFVKHTKIHKTCLRNLMQNVVVFKSSTIPRGFTKKTLLVSPIWTWNCITILTHADFKNRICSHEKPENLDRTWSKHVRTAPKTLSISRRRLTDNVSLAKNGELNVKLRAEFVAFQGW